MAKARPSRKGQSKSGRKPGNSHAKPKAAKSRRVKVVTAGKKVARPVARAKTRAKTHVKTHVKKARPVQKLARPPVAAVEGARKARISVSKSVTTEVMIPETPPPLPAPIASFTF